METVTYKKEVDVRYNADIAVFGSGIAGISAAIAAALRGASVILIERFGMPGGNSTSGGVASFCGNTVGQGEVFDMVVSGLSEFKAIEPLNREKSSRIFNHEILAVVLQELALRHGVRLLLHTRFVDVICEAGRIKHCLVCGSSGLEAVSAKVFIDCTGEGSLALRAGFSVMKGNEQGYSLPMSLMYFVRHTDSPVCEIPEGWFPKIESEDSLPMTSVWPNGPGGNAVKIKVPMFDSTDTRSLTAAEIAGRRKMMSVMDYHQRVAKKPWLFDRCSPIIGIREGCRIVGDYVLKVDDLRAGASFGDAVAVGTFYLDGHKPDDDKRTYILPKDSLQIPPYDIPLRCLTARDGENLLMAGRCLSADQLALSSARVTTTCSMTGQAAGIAAALSVQKNTDVRTVSAKEVRDIMEQGGAVFDKEKVKQIYKG